MGSVMDPIESNWRQEEVGDEGEYDVVGDVEVV
jgi:hypothetical protein